MHSGQFAESGVCVSFLLLSLFLYGFTKNESCYNSAPLTDTVQSGTESFFIVLSKSTSSYKWVSFIRVDINIEWTNSCFSLMSRSKRNLCRWRWLRLGRVPAEISAKESGWREAKLWSVFGFLWSCDIISCPDTMFLGGKSRNSWSLRVQHCSKCYYNWSTTFLYDHGISIPVHEPLLNILPILLCAML